MEKHVVHTTEAPKAIGPYSQAIVIGDMVYCSGQIPLDPHSGGLIPGGIDRQTHQVLDNLKAVLAEAGSGMDKVVKTTVFLRSMEDFAAMNAVYGEYFTANPPARTTIEVSNLPRSAMVEIDCIAFRG